jgi:hypothetical protein
MGEVQHGKTTKWKPNGKRTTKQNISKNKKTATTHTKSNEIKGFKGLHTEENKTKQNNRQIQQHELKRTLKKKWVVIFSV